MASGSDLPETSHVLELDGGVPDIGGVRRWAQSALAALDEDDVLDVLLVVTELVSNVYDHGRFPAQLRLHEWTGPCFIRVEVDDASSAEPVLRPLSPSSLRGRGLVIVDRLAQRWGVAKRALGKSVWALIPCQSTA